MIDMYVILVQTGKRTIEQVPERYRSDVQARLNA
jgi:hypothetical protein